MSDQSTPPPFQPPSTEQPIHQPHQPLAGQQPSSDATGGVIPYKNAPALIGYYLAVFSLIPVLGLILGIAAVILGIIGFRAYLKEPRKRGQVHAWVAIILGSITTLGNLFVVGLLLTNSF